MNNEINEAYLRSIQQQVSALQALVQSQSAQINELRQNEQRQKSGDLECNTVRCKAWKVVDSAGVDRMTAEISDNGDARILWCRPNGSVQIAIETKQGGAAGVLLRDADGVVRVCAAIESNGEVHLPTIDLKPRVPVSATNSSGVFTNYSEATIWKQDEREALDEETRLCDALNRDESSIIQEEEEDVFSTLAARFEDA